MPEVDDWQPIGSWADDWIPVTAPPPKQEPLPPALLERFERGAEARKLEGGILQSVPEFAGLMSSPDGRTKLWEAVKSYPAEFIKGMVEQAKTPGKVAKGEIDIGTQEGMDEALGLGTLIGLGRLNKLPLTGKTAGVALQSGEQFARVVRTADGQVIEQPVGGLPTPGDFKAAADILTERSALADVIASPAAPRPSGTLRATEADRFLQNMADKYGTETDMVVWSDAERTTYSRLVDKTMARDWKFALENEFTEKGEAGRAADYVLRDEEGRARIRARFLIEGEKATLEDINMLGNVDDVLPTEQARNLLGPTILRTMLREFRKENPEVKNIIANRVSGARTGGKYDVMAEHDINIELPDVAIVENNLRTMWEERGIHPAEAVHDAQSDAWLRQELTADHSSPFERRPHQDWSPENLVANEENKPAGEITAHALGADITNPPPPLTPLSVQPPPAPGRLAAAARAGADKLFDIGRDIQMMVAPMATGTRDSMAIGKDFANALRRNRWEWSRIDTDIEKRFNPEQRERMWNAADEESVARQLGEIGTPPVAPGLIRAYRGEGGTAHGLRGQPAQPGSAATGGWFTTDLAQAKRYGDVSYVDLSRDDMMHFAQGHGGPDELVTTNPAFRQRMQPFVEGQGAAEHMGLATLEPAERAAVEDLQSRAQAAWLKAVDLGMVEGEGLPAYTPRMVINAANAATGEGPLPLNGMGRNLATRTAQMRRRKYMTAEETEAAAKKALGEGAELARDIRVLPLATARLEDAVAGRTLIDAIKEYGKRTGDETAVEGSKPGPDWFTIDHPAFRTWRPKLERKPNGEPALEGNMLKTVKDADGNVLFEQVPIYVRGEFEGPLRAVLSQPSGPVYGALMSLKGKTMSLIMNSPLIHNAVEFGRAFPTMPIRIFTTYFRGNRAKNDVGLMTEAIDNGLVPIGKRFFNQDITSIMEAPDLTPGRSWTAQALGETIGQLPQKGLATEEVITQVKRDVDKAGDFWHNTLLWDRIADLQMGLYSDFHGDLIAKGVDRQTASRVAAHLANRYAGALPQEAMSNGARKAANLMFFSRTFTVGNLGVLKDAITGLPKDVLAQIERDVGVVDPAAVGYAKNLARRKAFSAVMMDIGLLYIANSIMQSALNVLVTRDTTLDEEMRNYVRRWGDMVNDMQAHPLSLISPLTIAGGGLGYAVGGLGGAALGTVGGMGLSALRRLSSTADNEPGKQERLKVGYTGDGTAIYARSPFGKIGEEFVGYIETPIDMFKRKEGTLFRPMMQVISNDKGFGRKVYDPHAETPSDRAWVMWQIIEHFAKAQTPEGQIAALGDLVKGEGDQNLAALQAFGPIGGVTFSKGAPGGPAVGELYHARQMHNYAVDAALPDIRRQIQRGDVAGAQDRMTELGISPALQRFYTRTSLDPATRLGGRTLRDFFQYATPEQRERLDRARQ